MNIQDPGEEEGPSFNASNADLVSHLVGQDKRGDEETDKLLEKDRGDVASRHSASRISKGGSEMNIKGAPSFKLQETAFQKRKNNK